MGSAIADVLGLAEAVLAKTFGIAVIAIVAHSQGWRLINVNQAERERTRG